MVKIITKKGVGSDLAKGQTWKMCNFSSCFSIYSKFLRDIAHTKFFEWLLWE